MSSIFFVRGSSVEAICLLVSGFPCGCVLYTSFLTFRAAIMTGHPGTTRVFLSIRPTPKPSLILGSKGPGGPLEPDTDTCREGPDPKIHERIQH